jgi:hypothetical protein
LSRVANPVHFMRLSVISPGVSFWPLSDSGVVEGGCGVEQAAVG